jgi:Chaperone of endosialidase
LTTIFKKLSPISIQIYGKAIDPKFNFYNTKTRKNTMSDIRLDDNNNVILDGNVGIGINNPARSLHVEGGLEVHSGGSGGGFSFSDRNKPGFVNNPTSGERWVWYAQDGTARFWSGSDKIAISKDGNVGIGTNNPTNKLHIFGSGPVTIENPNGEADILFKSGSNQSWQVGTDFNGWYVWDNAYRLVVKPGGNVGIGTTNPLRRLHVDGNEIHSGGSGGGLSFSDRSKPGLVDNPANGERWVWYAQNGEARLWSGEDVLTLNRDGFETWNTSIKGKLFVDDDLFVNGTIRGTVRVGGKLLGRDMGPDKKTNAVQFEANAIQLAPNAIDSSPYFALFHDLSTNLGKDLLIVNYKGGYKQGIKLEGNVQTTGALAQASSIAFKENVKELSGQEAMAALQGLNAVKYNYKADGQKEQHIGFIAEEVPDLVANLERDRLSPMDLIAVLTKAMQEQQRMIADLTAKVSNLGQNQS